MTEPQARFFQLDAKFPAFIGGFGSGKTETLANCALRDALESSDVLMRFNAARLQFYTNLSTRSDFGKGCARRIVENFNYQAEDA